MDASLACNPMVSTLKERDEGREARLHTWHGGGWSPEVGGCPGQESAEANHDVSLQPAILLYLVTSPASLRGTGASSCPGPSP